MKNTTLSLTASCIGFVLIIMDVSVVNVALNEIQRDLGTGISGLEWVVNGYTLTFAALLLTAGALSDRYGAKPVFQVGFLLFALSSLACGLSASPRALIVARISQGLGAALLVPASLAIVNQTFEDKAKRSRAVGLWAASGGMALALGPVIGGLLIHQSGWRSIFMVNIPIAAAGMWIAAVNVTAAGVLKPRAIDWPGQALGILALGGMTGAIIQAGVASWSSPVVLACLALFVCAAPCFLAVEHRSREPMLPLSMFREPTFASSAAIGVAVNFAFYGLIFTFSLFFQLVWSYSPLETGLALIPMTGAIMVANIVAGRLAARYGAKPVLVSGCALAALAYLAMVPFVSSAFYAAIVGQFVLAGFGIGLAVPSMTNAMLSVVLPARVGIASGVLNACRQIGGLLGVATAGLLVVGATATDILGGLHLALMISSAFLVVSAVLAFAVVGRPAVVPPIVAATVTESSGH